MNTYKRHRFPPDIIIAGTAQDIASFRREGVREFSVQPAGTPLHHSWHRFLCASVREWMEKICEGADTSAISRRLRMIERHHRVKDLGGASGFLPNIPFRLLILPPHSNILTAQLLVLDPSHGSVSTSDRQC